MSNTSDRVINAGTKVKSYGIKIGGVDLIKETIASIELSFRNDTPVVLGRLLIDDLYDMNSQVIWKDVVVKVFYMDVFDKFLDMECFITGITETYDEQFNKKYVIELQDKYSYKLQNSFLSKGFNTDLVSALKKYMEELGLTSYKTDFDAISKVEEFAVPKHIDNLTFFIMEFAKRGYTFYQTKEKIVVKHIDKLRPKQDLVENDPGKPFKNETDNQLYKNRISSMRTFFIKRKSVMPITKTFAYNPGSKSMVSTSDNDNSPYYLSNDPINLQTSSGGGYTGVREIYQTHMNFDQHRLNMKESFMRQSEVEIICNGYIKNDVNQVYELELKGNPAGGEQQAKGNTVISGKYVSNTVMDKLVGDSLIQRIHLYRADLTKRIK